MTDEINRAAKAASVAKPTSDRQVILSGMQPTGQLHLGNLEGALMNWVGLQDRFEMYCCIVDWHSLTADFEKTDGLQDPFR